MPNYIVSYLINYVHESYLISCHVKTLFDPFFSTSFLIHNYIHTRRNIDIFINNSLTYPIHDITDGKFISTRNSSGSTCCAHHAEMIGYIALLLFQLTYFAIHSCVQFFDFISILRSVRHFFGHPFFGFIAILYKFNLIFSIMHI